MNFVEKKGISLVALVITIIVSLILVSVGVATTGNAIENANITEYIDNLGIVRDSVEAYYINTGSFPSKDGLVYNQGEIISFISSYKNGEDVRTFLYDLRQNEDYYDSDALGEFYIIDLNKLGIEKTELGNGVKSDLDFFAISYPAMNIYYLDGMKLKNEVYFSLNKRLTYISNVNKNKEDNVSSVGISVETFDGITVSKNNSKWTNDLKLSISGDDLSIRLAGNTTFHNLAREGIVSTIEEFNTKGLLSSNFTANEINNFSILASELRYIEVRNNKSGSIFKVNLSNYDNKAPTINSCDIANNSEMTILTYSLSDFDSGIKEIRYDYLTKFDEDGNIVPYYNDVTIDKNYMLTKSKKVRAFENQAVSIKLPNNVNKVKVYIIDNAGNVIIEEDRVAKENYIGINTIINYFYSDGFNFSLDITGNFSKVEVSATNDKDSNDRLKTYSYVPKNEDFTGFSNQLNNFYLKIKVITAKNGREEETVKIEKISLFGNYPYIPNGFYYVGGDKNSGLVISDNESDKGKGTEYETLTGLVGNQFVWIPVNIDASSINNLKSKWKRSAFESGAEYASTSIKQAMDTTYEEPYSGAASNEIKVYNNMLSGVQKYKGFYVGRFETGAQNATSPRTKVGENTVNTIGVKKGLYVYNYVKFGNSMTDFSLGATYLANNMYNTSYVGSNLIFALQWDHIMKFIEKNASNSIEWGNYLDSIGEAAEGKGAGDYKTGRNASWNAKNIYDLAGNVSEWTMESNGSNARVVRGGNFLRNGTNNSAGVRNSFVTSTSDETIGFRVCLYLK